MCGQPLHIEDAKPVCGKYPRDGKKREIREMLMINGIELIIPHQTKKVRELHGNDAVIGKEDFEAADEIVQRRNMSENVVAENEIGLSPISPPARAPSAS